MSSPTPVRALGNVDEFGCRVLSDAGLTYADGAEQTLSGIVSRASDLTSDSQELADAATDWATRYSLTTVRANLLRGLDLPADARVLEIGCGCGPITRYLGETCALVDAVEPMAARARVARLRTRDLPHVAVIVGTLEDVPLEPTYDVVVVVGVLEYVAHGTDDPTPYLDFLRRIASVLRPDGTLVLAIENQVGVKYLVGAPEDHTDRAFDSIEGYPLPSPARTFTRERLSGMLTTAGFTPRVLGAFPDYKLPRVLLDDKIFDRDRSLAARIPPFPSPDYMTQRAPLADEGLAWRSLVDTGQGAHFANSFVVVADRGATSAIWPADRLAVAFTAERQPQYAVKTEITAHEHGIDFVRRAVATELATPEGTETIRHVVEPTAPHVQGHTLLERIERDPASAGELLRRWAEKVGDDDWTPVDLVPHNIIVDGNGELVVIDQEWLVQGYGRESHLVRGAFWSAVDVARSTESSDWGSPRTVRDIVAILASHVGVTVDEDVLERFVTAESAFQAAVNTTDPVPEARATRSVGQLRELLDTNLSDFREHRRESDELAALRAEVRRLGDVETELSREHARLTAQEAELEELRRRNDDSAGRKARRLAGKVRRRLS
jgi:SAM-dependent methyltransferase